MTEFCEEIYVSVIIGFAESGTIDSSVISSLLKTKKISASDCISSFKARLAIFSTYYQEAEQKDKELASWITPNTDSIIKKISKLFWIWSVVYEYMPEPERTNINTSFHQLMFKNASYQNYNPEDDTYDFNYY